MGDAAAAHRRGEDKVLKGPAGQKPIPQQSVGARWQKWLTVLKGARKHDNYINVLEAQAVFSILRWRTLTVRLHRRRDWDSALGFPGEGWRVSKMARKSCYVFWLKDKILLRRIQRGLDKLVADHEDAKFERRRAAIARRQAAAWVARAERVYMRTMRAWCSRRRTPSPDVAHIRANLAAALAHQLQMRRHLKEARERAATFGIIRERGLPCIAYPNIKTNRRPTTACKNALAKHSDLMNAIQLLCKKWGKTLKLERTTIRDALLEAFVTTETTKPTVKHEAKASTIATRVYLMITHQRRINKCPKTSAEEEHEGAEDDAQDSGEQDDQEGELGTEEEHEDARAALAQVDHAQPADDDPPHPPGRLLSSYAFASHMGLCSEHGSDSEADASRAGDGASMSIDGESLEEGCAHTPPVMDAGMELGQAAIVPLAGAVEDVFPEYDPVAQTAYVVKGSKRVEALRLHQPDGDAFVVATFAEGILNEGTQWEIPTLSRLPQRWGGHGNGMEPQQSRARKPLKRPASAMGEKVHMRPASAMREKVHIADHEYDIAQKSDRDIIYCIMLKKPGEPRKQVLQLTKPQMAAASIHPCDNNGWCVMQHVLGSISKCTAPVTSKATLQEFKNKALREVTKELGEK